MQFQIEHGSAFSFRLSKALGHLTLLWTACI